MVKNQNGGNKSKRMGRKFMSTGPSKTRFSEDPDEIYACCAKMHGPSCDVLCIDGKTRLCHIRNKFKGRGKRDSLISVGTWLLIGRRGFEGERINKKENSDLLEVYSENDKRILQQHEHEKSWDILSSIQVVNTTGYEENDVMFGDADTINYEKIINNATNTNKNVEVIKNTLGDDDDEEDEFLDVDDI